MPVVAATRGDRQLAGLWAGSVLALIVLSPLVSRLSWLLPVCPLKTFTGVPCPTCGTTRAAFSLAHFDVVGAITHYPLPTLLWTAFILGGLAAGVWVGSGRSLPSLPRPVPMWFRVGIVLALAGNWLFNILTGV
ncbi:MAG: DUF2752 domain-containing protein [Acidobacteriota bacterium]